MVGSTTAAAAARGATATAAKLIQRPQQQSSNVPVLRALQLLLTAPGVKVVRESSSEDGAVQGLGREIRGEKVRIRELHDMFNSGCFVPVLSNKLSEQNSWAFN